MIEHLVNAFIIDCMKIIGLEEHFATPELIDAWDALEPQWQDVALAHSSDDELTSRLLDVDAERIAAMDDTGLDVAVVSMTTPGLQNLDRADAVALQAVCNDRLADAVRQRPDRLQGVATLATPDPDAAAAELGRAITELGFNGAMLYGRTRDRNLDHPDFWPIFEAAEALNAPLYLHPQSPPPAVRAAYYSGLLQRTRRRSRRGIGNARIGLALRRGPSVASAHLGRGARPVSRSAADPGALGRSDAVLPRTHRQDDRHRQSGPPCVGVCSQQRLRHARRSIQPALPAVGTRRRRSRPHHVRQRLPLCHGSRRRQPPVPRRGRDQ